MEDDGTPSSSNPYQYSNSMIKLIIRLRLDNSRQPITHQMAKLGYLSDYVSNFYIQYINQKPRCLSILSCLACKNPVRIVDMGI